MSKGAAPRDPNRVKPTPEEFARRWAETFQPKDDDDKRN